MNNRPGGDLKIKQRHGSNDLLSVKRHWNVGMLLMYFILRKDDSLSLVIHTATKALKHSESHRSYSLLEESIIAIKVQEKVGILNNEKTNCL